MTHIKFYYMHLNRLKRYYALSFLFHSRLRVYKNKLFIILGLPVCRLWTFYHSGMACCICCNVDDFGYACTFEEANFV